MVKATTKTTAKTSKTTTKRSKIEGKGNVGDFVHANQEMGTKEGFKNVSKIWLDKCKSYDEVYNELEFHKKNNKDLLIFPYQIRAVVDEERQTLAFKVEDDQVEDSIYVGNEVSYKDLSYWFKTGTNAIADWLETAKLKKGREYKPSVEMLGYLAAIVNDSIDNRMDPQDQFLMRFNENNHTLRCVKSSMYARVDNEWVLDQYRQLIPDGKVSHLKGDSDTFIANILIPDTIREEEDSDYGGMVSVGNCEIGRRILSFMPSLFRAICMNGCIWDQTKGAKDRVKHMRKGGEIDLKEIRTLMEKNLQEQIPLSTAYVDRIIKAKSFAWDGGSVKPVLAELSKRLSLQVAETRTIPDGYLSEIQETPTHEKTGFAFINAITRAAQDKRLSDNQYENMNRAGGLLLEYDASDWDAVFTSARRWKAEAVDKLFATN